MWRQESWSDDTLSHLGPGSPTLASPRHKYSVFHVIVLQENGCCELVLGLIVSSKASM